MVAQAQSKYALENAVEAQRELDHDAVCALLQNFLNAIPGQCAVLNRDGIVTMVNREWKQFARENGYSEEQCGLAYGIGSNYFQVCEDAKGSCSTGASTVARGVRAILSGQAEHFDYEYPCHSPTEQRWFKCIMRPVTLT